jgi:hypothetical protein
MENFAELMQRLLEVQSGGRQRSPELIAEDEQLIDSLRRRSYPSGNDKIPGFTVGAWPAPLGKAASPPRR